MQHSQAVVGLGLVALVAGLLSLHSLFTRAEPERITPGSPPTTAESAEVHPWVGVDPSISRVLVELGLASSDHRSRGVPAEVIRALAALGVPLVITGPEVGS